MTVANFQGDLLIIMKKGSLILNLILLIAVTTTIANAATFTVTNTTDVDDGVCDANCSLREAINSANAAGTDDDIAFDATVFASAQTITLDGTDIIIDDNGSLTINGTGSNLLTISGNNLSRIFYVDLATVVINDITLSNGNGTGTVAFDDGLGGAIENSFGDLTINNSVLSNNITLGLGGAIDNTTATLNLNNSTVTGNMATDISSAGGGIFSDDGTLNITDSIISMNTADFGGGILNDTNSLTITNSTIDQNTANELGGGILHDTGTANINNSTVISGNNAGDDGGGIFNDGTLNIDNSTISGNTAVDEGGGIESVSTSVVTISNGSVISGNTAGDDGGGIENDGSGTINITDSTISNNRTDNSAGSAGSDGGGVRNSDSGIVNITSSTISGNQAFDSGGGIDNDGLTGVITIVNSTISGNSAGTFGGGITNEGIVNTTNATIVLNTADSDTSGSGAGGGVRNNNTFNSVNSMFADNVDNTGLAPDFSGNLTSSGFNLIENTTGITGTVATDITGVDPLIMPLADNGGQTQTHQIPTNSPAVDQGSSATAPFRSISDTSKTRGSKSAKTALLVSTDQRGNLRPRDLPGVTNAAGGDGSDIGALEALAPTSANVTVGGRVLSANGRKAISNAIVILTTQNGEIRRVKTNQFGYYKFDEVLVGETYIFNVYSKNYSFETQVVDVSKQLSGLDFRAVEIK